MRAQAVPRKKNKSEQRQAQILKHAVELFNRQGYSNTSLDDIAKAVGISREGIYYYFKNRSQILLAIVKPQAEAIIEGFRQIAESDRDPREKLYLAVLNHLGCLDMTAPEMALTLRDIYSSDVQDAHPYLNPIWKLYEHLWTDLVASGQAGGVFMRDRDPKIVAFGILGMCNWMGRWFDREKPVPLEAIAATFAEMIAFGVITEGDRRSSWFARAGE